MNSKEGQISVFYGAQIENAAEVACLSKLKRDLASQGIDAVLLANLTVGPSRRQIDLIVATNTTAVAVEIKGYVHSVQGKVNGPWKLELGNGKVKPLGRHNPYEQALTNRYAVTDGLGALLGISSETAKNVVAGMLCLYPKPMVGSRIPVSDFKLMIGGYEDLLMVLKIARREALPLEDWRRFARSLDLNDGSLAPPTEAEATVTHYLAAYDDLARVAAGPYIDPRFEKADTTGALAERIIAGAQVQIIGNSGSGKTELMKAVARSTAHAGCLPVLLRGGDFERQLAPLLQTAIARSSSVSPPKLFKAAADSGAEIILYVDGLNECPPKHRNELIEALQAARINYGARLIVTTQEQISLPKVLSGEVIRLVQPDRAQSQLLVAAHLGRKLTDNERDSVEVVATAHDAALLASVLETPSNIDGRFALYHSFVRTCLDVAYAEEMKNTLSTLATTMRTSFVSSLPVPSALRILNRNKPMTMEIACNSGLARIQDNRLAFRHDLIADFLAADGILHLASNAEELQALARQPINAELREFLLGGCGTISEIEALIGQQPDVRLLRAALSGRAGNKARNYVISRLRDLISLLKRNYSKVSLTLPEGVTRARDLLSLVPSLPDGIDNSEIDMAYMSIIPFALRDGLFTDLLDLFASVDSRLQSEAQRLRDAHPDLNISWQATTYGTIYGMHHHQAGGRELQNLLQSIQNQWFSDSDRVPTLHLEGYLDRFETLSPGQIFLCVAASRSGHSNPLPFRFPALLQHIWGLGIYHLELLICDIIRFRGGELPDDQRQVVSELLHDWMSNDNIFMNSIIIDALEGVDGIEIALTVEDAVNEYEAMLALPDSEEACSLAVGAITSTFDHPFRNVYWEAFFEALPIEKRQALLLRGLRNKRLDPWPIDDILRSLLREPTTDAAPELQKLAQIPILDSHSPQLALNVYANSIALLAKLAIPLASPNPPPDNPVHRAWYRAAVLIHALNADPRDSSRVTTSEVDEFRACGAAEAFDVIQRLVREKQNMLRPSNVDFESMWPDLVLELCRAALSSGYTPVSIFERTYFDRTLADDHFDLALSLMAKVGRATDISLVRAWLKHPKHGERALEAARSLERRSQ